MVDRSRSAKDVSVVNEPHNAEEVDRVVGLVRTLAPPDVVETVDSLQLGMATEPRRVSWRLGRLSLGPSVGALVMVAEAGVEQRVAGHGDVVAGV